jgi:hypothetical protein
MNWRTPEPDYQPPPVGDPVAVALEKIAYEMRTRNMIEFAGLWGGLREPVEERLDGYGDVGE